jgi:methionyl-tRNA formyltransferase
MSDDIAITLGPLRRVVLFGGGALLLEIADRLADAFDLAVITAPRHAEEIVDGAPLGVALERANRRFIVVERLDTPEVEALVGDMASSVAVSVGAAWIFTARQIDGLLGGRLFNVHGTRLPQNRGGGGFSWQIMIGNRFGSCLMHKVTEGIDTGDIVFFEEFLFPASCRTPADYQAFYNRRCSAKIAALLRRASDAAITLERTSQPEYLSSYWPRLHTPTHGWVNWDWAPPHIERFICAFDDPYSGAQTRWADTTVRLKKCSLNHQDGHFHPFQSGLVYRVQRDWLCVAAAGAGLVIEQVFDEHGQSMIGRIKAGDRFHTPREMLDHTAVRVTYGPRGLNQGW